VRRQKRQYLGSMPFHAPIAAERTLLLPCEKFARKLAAILVTAVTATVRL